MSTAEYRFVKVEDFFAADGGYRKWEKVQTFGKDVYNDATKTVQIPVTSDHGKPYLLVIVFLAHNIFRVRFEPANKSIDDYPTHNSRAVVCDTIAELQTQLNGDITNLQIKKSEVGNKTIYTVTTIFDRLATPGYKNEYLELEINKGTAEYHGFLRVTRLFRPRLRENPNAEVRRYVVWTTDRLYWKPSLPNDFSVIQTVIKPPTAEFIGFSEQGGFKLVKNDMQLTYFNYDNMGYRQVYNNGPTEPREPLYHSDPFFIEFNATADYSFAPDVAHSDGSNTTAADEFACLIGYYIDNPSQVCADVGQTYSFLNAFGTRFGGLDYYVFLGENVAKITTGYTAVVGRSKIKPRYSLGYHQGCYGYENEDHVREVVRAYRNYDIPLDGIAVDVDVQDNYRTFTINESKFPDPKTFFAELRAQGIKCCTNITPVISNQDKDNKDYYPTYREGIEKGYFVKDVRDMTDIDPWKSLYYQDFNGGTPVDSNNPAFRQGKSTGPLYPADVNTGREYLGEVWYGGDRGTEGHYPNLFSKEVRVWWGEQYQHLFDMGMEFIWQDMTTPAINPSRGDMRSFPFRLLVESDWVKSANKLDPVIKVWNLYSYNLHKATYQGLNKLKGRENKRNFIIGRGSFSGMGRYAGLWTGDNNSSWDFFRINIAQALSQGLSGVTLNGQDIGGFEGVFPDGKPSRFCDPELLIRWTAAGAFLPWFRNHYIRKYNEDHRVVVKEFQEPFKFDFTEDQFAYYNIPWEQRSLYKSVVPNCRYYIKLRYRLLQVFYDALVENCFNGLPISRAMVINEASDKVLFGDREHHLKNQFFVRKDFLVAPSVYPTRELATINVYLPAGSEWYQFQDNRRPLAGAFSGGTTIRGYNTTISPDENQIPYLVPMFVRSGAILPMLEEYSYVGQKKVNTLTFNIYPGRSGNKETSLHAYDSRFDGFPWDKEFAAAHDGEYMLYQDDGESRDSAPAFLQDDPEEKGVPRRYRQSFIYHKQEKEVKTIVFKRLVDKFTPNEAFFYIALLHSPEDQPDPITGVQINGGAPVTKFDQSGHDGTNAHALAETKDDQSGWYYNKSLHASFVKVPEAPTNPEAQTTTTITISYKQ